MKVFAVVLTHLVELVEVAKDDGIVWEVGEQLLAHLPPSVLLVFPGTCSAPLGLWIAHGSQQKKVSLQKMMFSEYTHSSLSTVGFVAEDVPEADGCSSMASASTEVWPWCPQEGSRTHSAPRVPAKPMKDIWDGRRPGGEDLVASSARVTVEVDKYVYAVLDNLVHELI